MLIQLLVGDDSGDGHNIRKSFSVSLETPCGVNIEPLTIDFLTSIYNNGSKICGIDITEYFQEYEESTIHLSFAREIENVLGIDFGVEHIYEDGEEVAIFPDDYIAIYIEIFNKNTLGYKMSLNRPLSIPIGGYGLFR